jgi:hypothetical protein
MCELRRELLLEKAKNMELQQQIEEMTQFLADYGLTWVGGPRPDFKGSSGLDYNLFMQKVTGLNALVANRRLEFAQSGNVATVKPPPSVEIALLETGFTLDGGDLRPYDAPVNSIFIQDILDGYFPEEFRADYPEGVRLTVADRRGKFKGPSRRIDDRTNCLEMLPPPTDIGVGDGRLKLRVPALPDVTIKVAKTLRIGELMQLIEETFDIREFNVCSPMSAEVYHPDATVQAVGLYPRGFALVRYK